MAITANATCDVTEVVGGADATYTFELVNTGSAQVVVTVEGAGSALLATNLLSPGVASVAVTAAVTGGTTGHGSDTDQLVDTVTMPAGASVTYTLVATAAAAAVARGTISQAIAIGDDSADKYLTVVAGPSVRSDRTREELLVPSQNDGSVNHDEIIFALLGGGNRDKTQVLVDYVEAGHTLADIFLLLDAVRADAALDAAIVWPVTAKNPNHS